MHSTLVCQKLHSTPAGGAFLAGSRSHKYAIKQKMLHGSYPANTQCPSTLQRTSKAAGFPLDILLPSVNIATLDRPIPTLVSALAASLDSVLDFSCSAVLPAQAPDASVLGLKEHLPQGEGRRAMEEDVNALVEDFACIAGCSEVKCQVFLTRTSMCSRLHVDHISLRLLRTYTGPGTEWLRDPLLSRVMSSALRWGGNPLTDALKVRIAKTAEFRQARVGEVVILKGSAFPGNEGNAIVHRSPEVCDGVHNCVHTR
eukprot:CAMPEP_0196593972 /NCGR_PEP_ID=MMETSP1081-20130531/77056_1 /TAXON_ID=36882 /ORGANISM="Pyramimonas amylifera, Strain CCMP720" /LENGTH=256 /DNA_ID=CAMNT_0041918109 /DNA_START=186 /DNA_END=952 /DNA_ORIENTATION=+